MKLQLRKFITVGLLPMPLPFASSLSFLFFSEIYYTLQGENLWFNEEWILLTDLEAIPCRRLSATNMWPSIKHTYTDFFFLQTPKSCLGSPSYQMCSFLSQHCLTGSLAHTPATKAIGDLRGHTSYHLKCSFYVLLEVHISKACSDPQQLFVLFIPGTTRPTIGLFVFSRDGDLKTKKRAQSSAPQTSASIQTWVIR